MTIAPSAADVFERIRGYIADHDAEWEGRASELMEILPEEIRPPSSGHLTRLLGEEGDAHGLRVGRRKSGRGDRLVAISLIADDGSALTDDERRMARLVRTIQRATAGDDGTSACPSCNGPLLVDYVRTEQRQHVGLGLSTTRIAVALILRCETRRCSRSDVECALEARGVSLTTDDEPAPQPEPATEIERVAARLRQKLSAECDRTNCSCKRDTARAHCPLCMAPTAQLTITVEDDRLAFRGCCLEARIVALLRYRRVLHGHPVRSPEQEIDRELHAIREREAAKRSYENAIADQRRRRDEDEVRHGEHLRDLRAQEDARRDEQRLGHERVTSALPTGDAGGTGLLVGAEA